jgi:hypothetical protein
MNLRIRSSSNDPVGGVGNETGTQGMKQGRKQFSPGGHPGGHPGGQAYQQAFCLDVRLEFSTATGD